MRGQGWLDGERRVRVGGDVLLARDAVVLAVGTGAAIPPIPGLAEVGAWSNREITTTSELPRRLVVLGGGVVGAEMAQAWRSLGAEVVVVEALDRLLSREEPFVGAELMEAFVARGIEVHTGAKAVRASRREDEVTIELESGDVVSGSHLLVAIGRRPLTDDIGLEKVGLEPDRYIEVDDQLRVRGSSWLYAVGDVNGRSLLTHSGKYQSRLAADHILGEQVTARADEAGAPRVVFSDPQVAAVGHTLAPGDSRRAPAR